MSKAAEWGFTPMIPPALVKPSAMEGTGYLGQGAADDVYYLEKDDLYLVGTSEVALAAYHSDEILEAESLPRRYAAFSPCYRREAGSYGKDTRGIFRVHWFDKVEMFVYTTLEESYAEHQRILGWEKAWLDALELPYRVIDVASGDLGLSAIRKFDCEAWIPTQGKYREVSSASNTTEFQARRLDIRVRGEDGTTPAATLNGTLCAMTRTIIALLENGQQADGSVRLPAALHPLLGEVLRPLAVTWKPRLIALDVDGTLVDGENVMSEAVRAAVHAVRDAGIETVIATGRGVPGVMDAADNLRFTEGYGVASNGAVTFRYDPEVELLDVVTFDASEAVRRVLEHMPEALVAVEEVGIGFRLNKPFPDNEILGQFVVEDVESLIAEPVARVVIRSAEHSRDEFTAIVNDLGLTGTNYYIGYSAWLDLAPEGVSKASGLEFLCGKLGIDRSEVLAVGDGNNDLEMIEWAGRGVAMGQAPDDVKAVADAIVGTIDEDGLVAELSKYI